MNHFKFYNKEDILYLTRLRRFETKLGERVQVLTHPDQFEEKLHECKASYILFGIPEDIGVKANYGKGGYGFLLVTFSWQFPEYAKQ